LYVHHQGHCHDRRGHAKQFPCMHLPVSPFRKLYNLS